MSAKLEILCSACGADALLRRDPVYEGFHKTGDRLLCSSCGHAYASEADVPFKTRQRPAVFTEADKLKAVDVFQPDEKQRNCRYCSHYTVNPFTQWCGLHKREVAATDSCPRFARRPDGQASAPPAKPERKMPW